MNIYRRPGLPTLILALTVPLMTAAQEVPYGHNLPPGSRPIEVKAHFFLSDINDINDQAETFEIKGVLALQWQDPRYAFDPEGEGIAEKRYQGTFQFMEMYAGWWPQLVLSNGVEPMSLDNVTLKISPDGTMKFIQEVSEVLESPMNLRRFPFDQQRLKAIFEPLSLYASEIRLVSGPEMTDLPERPVRIAGWELLALTAETGTTRDENSDAEFTLLTVSLEVKRHPDYTIWFIMVPLTIIVLLSTSIYWMDHESLGSRMDISFIGLLTIVAYQTLVETGLPQISYFTLMNGFIYVAYLTMAVCIVSSIWVEKLNRRGRKDLGDRVDYIGRWVVPGGFFALNLLFGLYFYYL
jgi:hypothetical protein